MVSLISASPHESRGAPYEPITPSEEEFAPDTPLTENRDADIEGQKVAPSPNAGGEGGRPKSQRIKTRREWSPEKYLCLYTILFLIGVTVTIVEESVTRQRRQPFYCE
ncbi:hypothetical protein F5144DRAFT_209278 [Chaetomium tenue]|uniref:Uncharacterized protein n=1 Tax=Chaetomium tenue TaxID=1854479 RepID=A0ACB7PDR3_9PEZI|nr:hypothetical protein F5144DRAFT_209278 [Chaetomium globosum]